MNNITHLFRPSFRIFNNYAPKKLSLNNFISAGYMPMLTYGTYLFT